jgi:hypothetical protein
MEVQTLVEDKNAQTIVWGLQQQPVKNAVVNEDRWLFLTLTSQKSADIAEVQGFRSDFSTCGENTLGSTAQMVRRLKVP